MAIAETATATASPIRRPAANVRFSFISVSPANGGWRRVRKRRRLQFWFLPHNNLGADRNAIVEVGHVGIDQPEATGRDRGADRIRPVGAVDAIDGGAEIHRAGAERVAGSAGHEARQIRLTGDHLRRRRPVRPFGFSRDVEKPLPLESFAADADAIAYRTAVALDQIKMAPRG